MKYGYMCAVDFAHEVGEAYGGIPVYASIEDIKEQRDCVDECGIIKVKIEKIELVEKGVYKWQD